MSVEYRAQQQAEAARAAAASGAARSSSSSASPSRARPSWFARLQTNAAKRRAASEAAQAVCPTPSADFFACDAGLSRVVSRAAALIVTADGDDSAAQLAWPPAPGERVRMGRKGHALAGEVGVVLAPPADAEPTTDTEPPAQVRVLVANRGQPRRCSWRAASWSTAAHLARLAPALGGRDLMSLQRLGARSTRRSPSSTADRWSCCCCASSSGLRTPTPTRECVRPRRARRAAGARRASAEARVHRRAVRRGHRRL